MAQGIASERDFRIALLRAGAVPILATMAGSACALVPIIATWPVLPPLGLIVMLGWRLMRPEMWPAWIGLPLGLFDDLMTGSTIGSAMFLWTTTLLVLDVLDAQVIWRDYWVDWLIAAVAVIASISGTFWLSGAGGTQTSLVIAIPQMLLSILCFPITVRVCRLLDPVAAADVIASGF